VTGEALTGDGLVMVEVSIANEVVMGEVSIANVVGMKTEEVSIEVADVQSWKTALEGASFPHHHEAFVEM
jgi:hypothetical protein